MTATPDQRPFTWANPRFTADGRIDVDLTVMGRTIPFTVDPSDDGAIVDQRALQAAIIASGVPIAPFGGG